MQNTIQTQPDPGSTHVHVVPPKRTPPRITRTVNQYGQVVEVHPGSPSTGPVNVMVVTEAVTAENTFARKTLGELVPHKLDPATRKALEAYHTEAASLGKALAECGRDKWQNVAQEALQPFLKTLDPAKIGAAAAGKQAALAVLDVRRKTVKERRRLALEKGTTLCTQVLREWADKVDAYAKKVREEEIALAAKFGLTPAQASTAIAERFERSARSLREHPGQGDPAEVLAGIF